MNKLITTKTLELRKWRYIAEGVIPVADQYDEDGTLISVGLTYKVGTGEAYLDGGEGHNLARFYDPKRSVQMEVQFPDGNYISGYISGIVGKYGVSLSSSLAKADGAVSLAKGSAVNPASAVYYVWRAD